MKEAIKDFLGNELQIGDKVVFMQLNYRALMAGYIVSMAPKSCLISHEPTNTGKKESRQSYSQLIKYTEPAK